MRSPVVALVGLFLGASVAFAGSNTPKITIDVAEGPNPWSHLEFHDDPNNFQFAVVADRTGRARPGVFEDAVVKLNLLQPEFVVSVGDLIQGGSTDIDRVEREWDEFDGFIDHLSMPFFYVPGNHDISNPAMADIWQRRHGRAYYHFVYKGVLFLCLNSEDPKFHISDDQIEYFRKVLAENTEVRWTLAFLHRPFWGYSEEEIVESNWHKFSPLLDGRDYTVFAGHWHDYAKYVRNDRKHFVLATTGGGSQLRGPAWGEFDHLVWITMTDDGPIIANLMLEGIWDEEIRDEEMVVSTNAALRGLAVREGSVYIEDPAIERIVASVRVENTADVPMEFLGTFEPHALLQIETPRIETTIPPNTVEMLPVKVAWQDSENLGRSGPVVLDYTIRYEFPPHQPIDIEGVHTLTVDRPHPISKLAGEVRLDGDLSEWGDLPFEANNRGQVEARREEWRGAEDSSFRFAVRRDDSDLLFAVRMVDDILVFNPDRPVGERDHLEVWIDSRPEPGDGFAGRWDAADPPFLRIAIAVGDSESMELEIDDRTPAGVRLSARRGERGFDVEMAVPIRLLDASNEGDWESFRLNVGQHDRDLTGRTKSLWWRPRWDSAAAFEGAGLFVR